MECVCQHWARYLGGRRRASEREQWPPNTSSAFRHMSLQYGLILLLPRILIFFFSSRARAVDERRGGRPRLVVDVGGEGVCGKATSACLSGSRMTSSALPLPLPSKPRHGFLHYISTIIWAKEMPAQDRDDMGKAQFLLFLRCTAKCGRTGPMAVEPANGDASRIPHKRQGFVLVVDAFERCVCMWPPQRVGVDALHAPQRSLHGARTGQTANPRFERVLFQKVFNLC